MITNLTAVTTTHISKDDLIKYLTSTGTVFYIRIRYTTDARLKGEVGASPINPYIATLSDMSIKQVYNVMETFDPESDLLIYCERR